MVKYSTIFEPRLYNKVAYYQRTLMYGNCRLLDIYIKFLCDVTLNSIISDVILGFYVYMLLRDDISSTLERIESKQPYYITLDRAQLHLP